MITQIPFEKIIQTALRHGADFAEVFVEQTRQTMISLDNRRLEHATASCDAGIGIRVICGTRSAYGSSNDLTKRNVLNMARSVSLAVRSKRTKAGVVVLTKKTAPQVLTVKQHPFGIGLEDKCNVVMRANEVAWKAGKEIRQVKILYRDTVKRIQIANSHGALADDEQVDTILSAHVVAGDGKIIQTGYEPNGGSMGFEIFDEMPPEEIAERAARRAISMLTARPAPAGTMPVIISARAGGTMIHEAVGHGLEADIACENMSVYSGKIGEVVASKLLTVVDDATIPKRRGSFTFDDEGTPAGRTVLIENGVLKTYMSDRAMDIQHGHKPTGNGRRQSYAHPPIVRMTNTMIAPGKDNPEAILKDTPRGLFVQKMGGGQVNTINGDFVFDVQEGYIIEGGKLGELARGATLIGNGPRVLQSVDRVGCDLGFSIGTCGKAGQDVPVSCGQPTIRIPEIVVGGTAK